MMRRLAGAAFWILLVLLVVANAIVMWHSLTVLRFWEDEAFNLTVPRNLVTGLGYTSDGTLSGSTLTPFDPRISTGPVVLLPVAGVLALGADPVIGARLVPLTYWVLLLIGCAVIGRRLAGRFGALVAVALPLAFNTADSVSPIQGPADLLGEIAAAAFIVWALIALPRRPWLAGLLIGLAVQAKLIALLALPAFAVALFLMTRAAPFRQRLLAAVRRALVPLALVAVPTVLVEFAALLSLGVTGYVTHLRALVAFVRSGGQHFAPTTVPQKLGTLASSWFVPWWLVAAVVVFAAGAVIWAAVPSRSRPVADDTAPPSSGMTPAGRADVPPRTTAPGQPARRWWEHEPQLLAIGFGSAVGLLAFVGWWAQASQLPLWVRHPAVGVFAFAPVLAAIAVRALTALWHRGGAHRAKVSARVVAAAVAVLVIAAVGGGAAGDAARALLPSTAQPLSEQRAIAAPVGDWARAHRVSWIGAQPWGAAVSLIVLADAHAGLSDAPSMRDAPILIGGDCPSGLPMVTPAPGINLCPAP